MPSGSRGAVLESVASDLTRGWLSDELRQIKDELETESLAHIDARFLLGRMLFDGEFAKVREPTALAAFRADERQSWEQLWAGVDEALATVTPKPESRR